jgi:hypothetical protein
MVAHAAVLSHQLCQHTKETKDEEKRKQDKTRCRTLP